MPASQAAAGSDGPDEPVSEETGSDIATPNSESQAQATSGEAAGRIQARAIVAGIDDFWYDNLVTEGTAAEVCYGSLRPGTLGIYRELTNRFGGTPGTLYTCRERYATNERAECNGQVANPVTQPAFFSDCWSNHAQGRALDIMVGTVSGGYNQTRGNNIVNYLLATDSEGNQNAVARRMGVQQILWNDRCWNSDGDRGIDSASKMRQCGYGHFDHVHIDLTIAGSEGTTSWWGYPPVRLPTLNSLFFQDAQYGAWEWRTWVNLRGVAIGSGVATARFSTIVRGDWDGDGVLDELFAWDPATGQWQVRDGTSGAVEQSGSAARTVETFVNGDFDGDGRWNDMILFDQETGYATLWSWSAGGPSGLGQWRWGPGWDRMTLIDGNSDGTTGELFLMDLDTGYWYVFAFLYGQPYQFNTGRFAPGWRTVTSGDLDAQGNYDDLFLRDPGSGVWTVINFTVRDGVLGYPVQTTYGRWLPDWDDFVVGDWDTDGRLDDMFLYDRESGGWTVLSWHRYLTSYSIISQYVPGLDIFASATLG